MNSFAFNIDVYGENVNLDKIVCHTNSKVLRYVFSPNLKENTAFHLGLFASKAVLSQEVFRYPRHQRICLLTESPIDYCYQHIPEIVKRFPIIFTHQESLLKRGKPFLPLMFGTNWLGIQDDEATLQILEEHPKKTSLVSFLGSIQHPNQGAYSFRREVASYVVTHKKVDCFGKGIKEILGKREALAPYFFSIAMENTANNYYFSEKLIDCILLETVPIYFGCPGINTLLDPRGMFTFSSQEELKTVLEKLTPEIYSQMYPYLLANKHRIIEEQLHNHQGLLTRLAELLPQEMLDQKPRMYRYRLVNRGSKLSRLEARLTNRFINFINHL